MKVVVVYESMYGNTHLIADAIGRGIEDAGNEVLVLPVARADVAALADAGLLVVGGPTHVHGLTRESTRKAAVEAAEKPGSGLELDPDAEGEGLRDWFDGLDRLDTQAAAFDTRMEGPPAFTGRASKGIAKRLEQHGCALVVEPESFLVTKENHLEDDEELHASRWGGRLAAQLQRQSVS
jgi:Flavodoxin